MNSKPGARVRLADCRLEPAGFIKRSDQALDVNPETCAMAGEVGVRGRGEFGADHHGPLDAAQPACGRRWAGFRLAGAMWALCIEGPPARFPPRGRMRNQSCDRST